MPYKLHEPGRRHIDKLKLEATIIDLPIGTVRSRASGARRALRIAIDHDAESVEPALDKE